MSPILGLNGYAKILPAEREYGWQIMTLNTPVVAIGGIEVDDIDALMKRTAVHGIAVSGLIKNSNSKKELIKEIKNRLQ